MVYLGSISSLCQAPELSNQMTLYYLIMTLALEYEVSIYTSFYVHEGEEMYMKKG